MIGSLSARTEEAKTARFCFFASANAEIEGPLKEEALEVAQARTAVARDGNTLLNDRELHAQNMAANQSAYMECGAA